MSYGIFRVEKIKASDSFGFDGRLKHCFRIFENMKNADSVNNLTMTDYATAKKKYSDFLAKCHKRSDSVGAFELVFTSSERADWSELDYKSYLNDCSKWAKKNFGSHLITSVLHMDEKVPHLHMFFCPIETVKKLKKQTKEEKEKGIWQTREVTQLNATRFIDGKNSLIALQNDFFESVCKRRGFERGEPAELTHRTHERTTLKYEIERYKGLSSALEAEKNDIASKRERLELIHETMRNFPQNRLAEFFYGLSDQEIQACWQELKKIADKMRDSHSKTETRNKAKVRK